MFGFISFQFHFPVAMNLLTNDRLCALVIRVLVYRTEMYCVSCEVGTEFICVMQKKVNRPCGLVVRVPGYRSRRPGSIPGATRFEK
jgi:hypothetical protein